MTKTNQNKNRKEVTITRIFDAPREVVWKAWTDSELLAKWWGPKALSCVSAKLDFRPGGMFHYSTRSPDGKDMWGKLAYREIVKPERIVFIYSFSDLEGNTVRSPFGPTWPLEVWNTLTLSEYEGKTKLTIRAYLVNATEEERNAFETGSPSIEQGQTGALDRLAELLTKR